VIGRLDNFVTESGNDFSRLQGEGRGFLSTKNSLESCCPAQAIAQTFSVFQSSESLFRFDFSSQDSAIPSYITALQICLQIYQPSKTIQTSTNKVYSTTAWPIW